MDASCCDNTTCQQCVMWFTVNAIQYDGCPYPCSCYPVDQVPQDYIQCNDCPQCGTDNITGSAKYCYGPPNGSCHRPCGGLSSSWAQSMYYPLCYTTTPCPPGATTCCYRATSGGCNCGCSCLLDADADSQQLTQCGTRECGPGKHCYVPSSSLKPVGPCQSWNQATVTWTGSSPGTWTGPWGGGAAPVMIESINEGTAVQISSGVTCNPPDLQRTYTWSITSSSEATVASGSGSTASFIPESLGSYTAIFNASCGGAAYQTTCSIPLQIDHITSRPVGGPSAIPFTCSCDAWSPVTVTWPGGSESVLCTPAAPAPEVNIPSITPGTAVQISSSVACGPGIFNIFTHEACPASEKWAVTSAFSGQGPWTGSGSTASFAPTEGGSFTVVFNASCGNAACRTICKIHIDIKNVEPGGLQPSAPVITSFTASQTQVSPNESVTLNWTITGDGEATLECAGEKHSVAFTGSTTITPAQSGCCTLTASNQCGKDQKTVCITVVSPPVNDPVGGCCANGRISQATQSQCVQIGGKWYPTEAQAMQACQPMCWCCRYQDHAVGYVTVNECSRVGTCYSTQGLAMEACQPPCWCCMGGKVYQATQAQCAQMGGACYSDQSQAIQACQQAPIPPPLDTR